jgi:hypothetical protein
MTSKTNVLQAESTPGCHSVMIDHKIQEESLLEESNLYMCRSIHCVRLCSIINTDIAYLTLQLRF